MNKDAAELPLTFVFMQLDATSIFTIPSFSVPVTFVFCIVELRKANYHSKVIFLFNSSKTFGIFSEVSFFRQIFPGCFDA